MLQYFQSRLKREAPSYFISDTITETKELSCVFVKYKKGNTYYSAMSFYTPVWISRLPFHQESQPAGSSLRDVATVVSYASKEECMNARAPTARELLDLIDGVKDEFIRQSEERLPLIAGCQIKYSLTLSPVTLLSAVVFRNSELLGTFIMMSDGAIRKVQSFSAEFDSMFDIGESALRRLVLE